MNILFLSRWYPYPPDNGSKLRIHNLLDGLCREHRVSLLSFFDPENDSLDAPLPSVRPREITIHPYRHFNPLGVRASLGFLSNTPRFLLETHSADMARSIERAMQMQRFDLVIASQIEMASYFPFFRGAPAIFEEAELALFCPANTSAGLPGTAVRRRLRWEKYRRYMARLAQNFRACTVASDTEKQLLAAVAPTDVPIEVVPNSIDVESYQAISACRIANAIVFAGSFQYAPNYDGMAWFLQNVYARIAADVPEVCVTITGHPGPNPTSIHPGVRIVGYVPDVRPIVASAAVSVAPIFMGGGTRVKILEAMALRTPVVTTSKGVEGLSARHGEHLLIADGDQEFARSVVCLLKDPEYARRLSENAYNLVRTTYDARVIASRFARFIESTVHCAAPYISERPPEGLRQSV